MESQEGLNTLFIFIGLLVAMIAMIGIIARRRATKALNDALEQLHLQIEALNAAANAVVISDREGRCIWVNPAFTSITGYSSEEIVGEKLSKLKSGVQDEAFYRDLWQTIMDGKIWNGEIINKNKQGQLYTEEMTIAPVRNKRGEITHFIAIKQDISERKRNNVDLIEANRLLKFQMEEIQCLQEELREQAIRDPLTNLYNRRFLDETLERELAHARREEKTICIAMIDVDNFKGFNDRYGHKAGDLILKSLGDILLANTRRSDVGCRYGGEEFAVVMPDANLSDARKRAQQWRKAFQLSQNSFNGQELQATVSIGVASFPEHGENGDAVLNAADKALYESKRRGKNRVTVYEEVASN
jgi:diguanylate cyclase (GGDEF)-like protein/PAS domain S-box-containing protein